MLLVGLLPTISANHVFVLLTVAEYRCHLVVLPVILPVCHDANWCQLNMLLITSHVANPNYVLLAAVGQLVMLSIISTKQSCYPLLVPISHAADY